MFSRNSNICSNMLLSYNFDKTNKIIKDLWLLLNFYSSFLHVGLYLLFEGMIETKKILLNQGYPLDSVLRYPPHEIWFTLCTLYLHIWAIWATLSKDSSICQPLKSFLWRHGIKLEVLVGFKNFQIVAHGLLRCHFSFWPVFNASKKSHGILQ